MEGLHVKKTEINRGARQSKRGNDGIAPLISDRERGQRGVLTSVNFLGFSWIFSLVMNMGNSSTW